MNNSDSILSILNAIEQIHLKPKKKTLNLSSTKNTIAKLNHNPKIPSDISKLISEAEEYKRKHFKALETISTKNNFNKKKREDIFVLNDEVNDEKSSINQKILLMINKVKSLEDLNEKLNLEIKNFKTNKTIISANYDESINSKNFITNTKKNLKSIYSQVEEQKQLFLDLKKHSTKIERDADVYKENYERLIIENSELKARLEIAKEQIVNYKNNRNDLLSALDQLNEILSKSNIIGKISPLKPLAENSTPKKNTKTDTLD